MHLVATVLNNGLDEMHLDESWRDEVDYDIQTMGKVTHDNCGTDDCCKEC